MKHIEEKKRNLRKSVEPYVILSEQSRNGDVHVVLSLPGQEGFSVWTGLYTGSVDSSFNHWMNGAWRLSDEEAKLQLRSRATHQRNPLDIEVFAKPEYTEAGTDAHALCRIELEELGELREAAYHDNRLVLPEYVKNEQSAW